MKFLTFSAAVQAGLSLFASALATPVERSTATKPAFFLAGDSTTAINGGWGDGFLATLVNRSIGTNFAHSGATTASFVAGGYWAKVLNAVKENKSMYHPYVTIQFGHNDQKSTSGISISQFTANLEKMVADVRAAGGSPILVTSLSRRTFDSSGHVVPSLANVVAATIAAAKSTNCEYVDLNKASTNYLNKIGAKDAATYNLSTKDYTHLDNAGMILFGNMMGWLLQTTIASSSLIAPFIHPRSDVVAAIESDSMKTVEMWEIFKAAFSDDDAGCPLGNRYQRRSSSTQLSLTRTYQ